MSKGPWKNKEEVDIKVLQVGNGDIELEPFKSHAFFVETPKEHLGLADEMNTFQTENPSYKILQVISFQPRSYLTLWTLK